MEFNSTNNMINATLAALGSSWQWMMTAIDPTTVNLMASIVMPLVLFLLGKVVDFLVRRYFENRRAEREIEKRGSKEKDDSNSYD